MRISPRKWVDLDDSWNLGWGKSHPIKFSAGESLQGPRGRDKILTFFSVRHRFCHFRCTDFRETWQEYVNLGDLESFRSDVLGLDFGSFDQILGSKTRKRYDAEKAHQEKAHPWRVLCRIASVRSPKNVSAYSLRSGHGRHPLFFQASQRSHQTRSVRLPQFDVRKMYFLHYTPFLSLYYVETLRGCEWLVVRVSDS